MLVKSDISFIISAALDLQVLGLHLLPPETLSTPATVLSPRSLGDLVNKYYPFSL